MSHENEPPTPDPMALWNAWYAANIEAWSQGMANLVANDVFAQAMAHFLDNYFTTSASLQKVVDYHMGAWLTTLNMPTREDLSRLERQLLRAEFPLDDLQEKLDQLAGSLQQKLDQQVSNGAQAASSRLAALESTIQSLAASHEQVVQALHEQAASRTSNHEKREQQLADLQSSSQTTAAHTEQLMQQLETHQSQAAAAREAHNARLHTLETSVQELGERLTQVAQRLDQQPAPAPTGQNEKIASLETRLQSLEDRTREVLDVLRSLQADMRAANATLASARSPRSKGGGGAAGEHSPAEGN